MGIGEDKDFRMVGFQQVQLFGGQDHIGGVGSAMLEEVTGGPFGGSNFQNPSSPGTTIALGNNNFTFPGVTLPNVQPPVVNISGGGGSTTPQLLVDGGTLSPAVPVSQITFIGSGLVDVTLSGTVATVEYQDTGGGPGGTTIEYGKITSSVQISATEAKWDYTVQKFVGGTGGISVTAQNLLEEANTTSVAYGYAVVSGNKISGTNFYVREVPTGTFVSLTTTTAFGSPQVFLSAPNPIIGSC
jgi:hypothetical protein